MIRVDEADRTELQAFLRRDAPVNLFLLGVLERAGAVGPLPDDGTFHALRGKEGLRAVAYTTPGGLAVAYAPNPDDAAALGADLRAGGRVRPRLLVGPRGPTDALWRGLGPKLKPRLWRDHRLYIIRPGQLLVRGDPAARVATPRDLEAAIDSSASMQSEELGLDPRSLDGDRFRRRVARLVAEEAIWILPAGGLHTFQASASTHCADGAQIEAVYTPPFLRGKGWATRGLSRMCECLLEKHPLLALHVNEDNREAVRLYLRLGFVAAAPFRLISG